jgi:serine/threonine protein kinase
LNNDDECVLGDFGISMTINGTLHTFTTFGTPIYNSPEVNQGKKYNLKSDIWLVLL